MPKPSERTTKKRRIFKKTPKGKVKRVVKKKKPAEARCAICGKKLQGGITTKRTAKTKKIPGRKYAGHLCHSCTQKVIKLQTRINEGKMYKKDADIKYQKYLTGKQKQ